MTDEPAWITAEGEEIDSKEWAMLESALEDALAEARVGIEELPRRGFAISVAKVRTEILTQPEPILKRTKAMREGWREASKRLRSVRFRPFRVLKSRRLAIAIAIAIAIGVVSLFTSEEEWREVPLIAAIVLLGLPVYLRQVIDGTTLTARARASQEAERRLEAVLRSQAMIAVRELINRRVTSFATVYRIFDREGLRQLTDPDREVPTTAIEELNDLIESLDSGSIGLSGPRGCGKTTIISSFTEGRTMPFNRELIGLSVPAPVKYDARDFVLHLFASLCERVLRNRPGDLARSGSRWGHAEGKRKAHFAGIVAVVSGAASAVLYLEPNAPGRQGLALGSLALSILAAYVFLIIFPGTTAWGRALGRRIRIKMYPDKRDRTPWNAGERAAKTYLKQIRFQQSHATGRTGGVGLSGVSLGASTTTTLARTPWTLPEAVEEFRRFAATLSERYVVIGIDELDKMESDEAAREFLNNVKGVFGVPGCYFLVSVSEDAMSAFERRGLPLRDVFDSAFDEIQRVGYLTLDQSRAVLGGRVTGLPVPFQCLCHCLAAGLPRDLIRVTRELDQQYGKVLAKQKVKSPVSLTSLTAALIEAEWRGKLEAAIASTRSTKSGPPLWLSSWLDAQLEGPLSADGLRKRALEIGCKPQLRASSNDGQDEDMQKVRRIAVEMIAFNFYAATVLDFFHDTRTLEDPSEPKTLDREEAGIVETLARARQQFSVDPWLSWEIIESVRTAAVIDPWDGLRPPAGDIEKSPWIRRKAEAVLGIGP